MLLASLREGVRVLRWSEEEEAFRTVAVLSQGSPASQIELVDDCTQSKLVLNTPLHANSITLCESGTRLEPKIELLPMEAV